MKTISNNDIALSIYLASKDKKDFNVKNVINFLIRRRALSRYKEILLSLKNIVSKEEGVVNAKILSAEKLTNKMKDEVSHLLKKRYAAKEVILEEKVDEKLLGGMRIEVNDEVMDLTLKNKIGQLQKHLTSHI